MSASAIHDLARPEVPPLPAYNAGLSSQAVRTRYGVVEIARLASNENPFGASPAVARALVDLALQVGTYPDANCTALGAAIAERTGARAEQIVIGNGSESISRCCARPSSRTATACSRSGPRSACTRSIRA